VLEDLDTIDLVMQGEPGEVIIKIIDGGVTTDLEEFNALLKAKIGQAINALADDGNYEAAGRPERLRIRGRSRSPWCSSRASRATQCPSDGEPG